MKEKSLELDKELKKMSRKALSFSERWKLKKIKDKNEKREALVYLLYSKLHLKYLDLLHKWEKSTKKSFSAEMHLKVVPAKLKFFKIDPKKENFYNLLSILKKIERELNNESA